MTEYKELLESLTVLEPGIHEFIVKEVLFVDSGDLNDPHYGRSVIFETTDGKTIIMDEDELNEYNDIVSRHSVKEGMTLKKDVSTRDAGSWEGYISQTT